MNAQVLDHGVRGAGVGEDDHGPGILPRGSGYGGVLEPLGLHGDGQVGFDDAAEGAVEGFAADGLHGEGVRGDAAADEEAGGAEGVGWAGVGGGRGGSSSHDDGDGRIEAIKERSGG